MKNLSVGRSVRATLTLPDADALRGLAGVRAVEIRGERVIIQTTDSDAVARHLLNATDAHDLEVVAHNLEDAFLSLTGDGAPAAEERS